MPTNSARARLDLGKLVMIPVAALMLALDLATLARHGAAGGVSGALHWLGVLGFCAFYSLVMWCYLRRGPALATSRSATAHAAAFIATLMPFPLPLLQATSPGLERQLASSALVLAGVAWSVWALHSLGPNLSAIAQARGVVERGPYRLVRHPLYTGEMLSALGLAIAAWSPASAGLWLALCGLQAYRAMREEQVLLLALPTYRAYRVRTAALLPGIF